MEAVKICQYFAQKISNFIWILVILAGCREGGADKKNNYKQSAEDSSSSVVGSSTFQLRPYTPVFQRNSVKLGHAVNTTANEYLPVCDAAGSMLFFSAMDRTGFFDFKLDFTKQLSSGGEDIFFSEMKEGVWLDARPLTALNTNGHEVVTQVLKSGNLMITGNYPEKLGSKKSKDASVQTTDLFYIKKLKSGYQNHHLPEPVNSIYTEADGWMSEDETFILFVSDRPGNIGEYHKKGWRWNESFWGNTDIYVSPKDGDHWSVPVNLGTKVNTPFAERTPWLSKDGLTLFISSNGYVDGKKDLDVYAFRRKSLSDWTSWEGPFRVDDASTPFDDWGYKETDNGEAFVASAHKLSFKPTQGGSAGDAGIFETNYRPGYDVFGLQAAALNNEFETNIYHLQNQSLPSFIVGDVFFGFNSSRIKRSFEKYLLFLTDQIALNKSAIVEICGHTDNVGESAYNLELSLNRAVAIKDFFTSNGVINKIVTKGFGDKKPSFPNTTSENRSRNRRVEIYLKTE